MSIEDYWIGKGINIRDIWQDYDQGGGYIDKFHRMQTHLLQIRFGEPNGNLPLFQHEALFKTLKYFFHEVKRISFTTQHYEEAGPTFLYSVERGSGEYNFLVDLRQGLLYGTTLADQQLIGQGVANLEAKFNFIEKHFGMKNVYPDDFERFVRAKTPADLQEAALRIYSMKIKSVSLSLQPFNGQIEKTKGSLIDFSV